MKKGFTLVELSIVLVIIGLLIGGILVAQSLIDSARINQAIRQIQQYDIAVSNFQERFRQLPGDSSLIAPAGNNDGDIDFTDTVSGGVPVCGEATCREHRSFWKHLSDTNMLNETYNNDFSNGYQPGVNSPEFFESFTPSGFSVGSQLFPEYSASDSGLFGAKGWRYTSRNTPGLASLTFERKLDDSNPATGFIRGNDAYLGVGCSATTDLCFMSMTMMATNGNPLNN